MSKVLVYVRAAVSLIYACVCVFVCDVWCGVVCVSECLWWGWVGALVRFSPLLEFLLISFTLSSMKSHQTYD